MGQTIAEKILSESVGRNVAPGEIVRVEYDLAASNDVSTPATISKFREMGAERVADPNRVAIVPDHHVPSHNIEAQQQYTACKEFAESQSIERFYTQSETGLMHAVLPEDGHVNPGDVVVGADSHTTTYGALGAFATGIGYTDLAFAWANGWTWLRVPESVRVEYRGSLPRFVRGKDLVLRTVGDIGVDGAIYQSVEFGGEAVSDLPMDDRFSLSNMILEAGAMAGLVEPDQKTAAYAAEHASGDYELYAADPDGTYDREISVNCSDMEPQIAVPHLPENVQDLSAVEGISVDQAVIGSCTNCRVEDLRQAAKVLEGHRIDPAVRLIVTPGSRRIQSIAYEEGWMETFHRAGATLGSPGCGACFGEHIGVLDEDEVAISTTNRNFIGRMGHDSSEVYLSNPAVAAASAVMGEITHPKDVLLTEAS